MKNIERINYFSLIFTIVLSSCNNEAAQEKNKLSSTASITESSEIIPSSKSLNDNGDSIVYDSVSFPAGDHNYPVKVLTTGIFHEDEVWTPASKENWYGLFRNKTGFFLASTGINTTRIHDVVIDEKETDKTGWKVETKLKDTCLVLIEALPFLNEHTVQNIVLPSEQVLPGDTFRFAFMGADYRIFATGGRKRVADETYEVWNYKLYIEANKNGRKLTELLVARASFDDTMISIIFAGDIDGDGLLDLIIDTSSHYNATIPTIYLSKPADDGHLLKVMGSHTRVGC
jgi:hypothetical protein